MNLFFTAALMPTIVESIGGFSYFAWVTTAFVVVAIVSTLMVSPMMDRHGPARTYVAAFVLFGLGTAVSAASSNIAWFIFSRALQGLGDRKSTRLNSSHVAISYAVFCLKKKK